MTIWRGGLERAAGLYGALVEWFIPEPIRSDREAANQARMFLIGHSLGPLLGNAVPLAVLVFDPTPGPEALVLAGALTLFWVFPFLLRWGVRYDLLVLTSVVNINFCVLWSCYFYGGLSSPTLPWLLIIPILSLFYVGGEKRLQPHLLAISGASFSLFLAISLVRPPPPVDMPLPAIQGLGIVSTVAALCYLAAMAIYYARIFDAGIALETEVRRRRQAADELRLAVAAADRAGSAKAEFLARMSHELRTPLNAIIGYSQLLLEETEDEEGASLMRGDVDRIHDAGQYLLRLVNMILDLSRIEAGRMQFDVHRHEVRALVAAAVEAKRPYFDLNGNQVSVAISPDLVDIEVDGGRLTQILEAVIENAAQHTRHGRIRIEASAGQAEETGLAVFSISDTGKGIDPTVLPTLFETFKATRDASGGRYGGTGLNLTVVHRLCLAMGGGIGVTSTPGIGSTFRILMPRQQSAAQAALEMPAPRLAA